MTNTRREELERGRYSINDNSLVWGRNLDESEMVFQRIKAGGFGIHPITGAASNSGIHRLLTGLGVVMYSNSGASCVTPTSTGILASIIDSNLSSLLKSEEEPPSS